MLLNVQRLAASPAALSLDLDATARDAAGAASCIRRLLAPTLSAEGVAGERLEAAVLDALRGSALPATHTTRGRWDDGPLVKALGRHPAYGPALLGAGAAVRRAAALSRERLGCSAAPSAGEAGHPATGAPALAGAAAAPREAKFGHPCWQRPPLRAGAERNASRVLDPNLCCRGSGKATEHCWDRVFTFKRCCPYIQREAQKVCVGEVVNHGGRQIGDHTAALSTCIATVVRRFTDGMRDRLREVPAEISEEADHLGDPGYREFLGSLMRIV
ncbi:unnamed protein product [Prorocentrum cordatum]|uniref:Uncharacterized protein n=1 Tax=Prorocentrum cordatum TaxID=2364126 RepID=A0ABN9V3B4_9DINO|nr:unnamed protein product [Polarella glacialis]